MTRFKMLATTLGGTLMTALAASGTAFAQEEAAGGGGVGGLVAIGAGLAIAGAAFGAALGQGRAVAAAMESIGRNPN
jgi:F0F1-type ATP synthase membrane subunit c/vacuolar-type H+-ATPase subunit K